MKIKKICLAISIILIALVFGTLFWTLWDKKSKEKTDIMAEVFAEVCIPKQEGTFNIIGDRSLHISQDEKTIFLPVQCFKEADTQGNKDTTEMEMQEAGVELYKVTKENDKFINLEKINNNDYYINYVMWDGDKLYFAGDKKSDTDNDLPFVNLYSASLEENNLVDIQQIKFESDIRIIKGSMGDIKDGKIIFYGMGDNSAGWYTGNLSDNKIKNLGKCDDSDLKANDEKIITALNFSKDTNELIIKYIYIEDEEEGYKTGYEMADLTGKSITGSRGIEFSNRLADMDKHICFEINAKKNTVYYGNTMSDYGTPNDEGEIRIKIYKVNYGKNFNYLFNNNTKSDTVKTDKKSEYHSGDYSYDEYDTGDFEAVKRNKSDKSEKQGVYYEIFVRSFADSNGDGIGDFNGIRQKLDYLAQLGIEGIWLMPVNASPSYHGYDITDYMSLNSDYGTEEDFANLISEAHTKGIKIIMDFPINHTSSEHPWFKSALSDKNSEYRNYYRWVNENDSLDFDINDESNWGSKVWHKVGDSYYYGMFGADMPDLNYNNPKVREEIKKAAGKWLEMGIDGFRLDAAMHIYGVNEFKQEENPTESTIQWWNEFAVYCENINPNVYLVGEAWNDDEVLEEYVQPFDTKFNFAFEEKLLEAVTNGTAVIDSQSQNLSDILQNILDKYAGVDKNYLDGVFGTNHDQNRVMSQVGNESKARLVANIYLTLPGNPYIYYGEELGMYGSKPDEMIRTPFKWTEGGVDSSYNTKWITDEQNNDIKALNEQVNNTDSMYNFYKNLIAVRKSNSALLSGSYMTADLKNDVLMAYKRENEEQKLLIIHNLSSEAQTIDLSEYNIKGIIYNYSKENGVSLETGGNSITLSGESSVILEY